LDSILYPVIGEPPLFDGADQERLICVDDVAVAESPVGAPGTVRDDDDCGCAYASADGVSLVPNDVIAYIR
jgi:hypothetical protein